MKMSIFFTIFDKSGHQLKFVPPADAEILIILTLNRKEAAFLDDKLIKVKVKAGARDLKHHVAMNEKDTILLSVYRISLQRSPCR